MEQLGAVARNLPEKLAARGSQLSRRGVPATPAKVGVDGLPVSFDPEVDRLKDLVVAAYDLSRNRCELRRALAPAERAALETRAAALAAALAPFDSDSGSAVAAVESDLAAMFTGYRSMRATGPDMEATVRITRHVLRKFPGWAIRAACEAIAERRSLTGISKSYAPNDGEIADEVRAWTKNRSEALRTAVMLLEAPVQPPRAAAAAHDAGKALPPPMTEERRRALAEDLAERKRRNEERAQAGGGA